MSDERFSQSAPYMPLITTTSTRYLKDKYGIYNIHIAQCLAEYCIFEGLEIVKTNLVIGSVNILPDKKYHFLGYHADNDPRNAKAVFVEEA